MSGYMHRRSIPAYPTRRESEDDDDTYLRMNQFEDRPVSPGPGQFSSRLNSMLMRSPTNITAHGHPQPFRPPTGFNDRRNDRSPVPVNDHSTEWSNPTPPPPGPRPKPQVPNYTPWDPAGKVRRAPPGPPGNPPIPTRQPPRPPIESPGLPGNPPIPARLPPRSSVEGPAVDDQEAYLSFEQPQQERFPPHSMLGGPPPVLRRPPMPVPMDEPHHRHLKSPYDDHSLPLRLPQMEDQPPERPPPPPPTQTSPTNHSGYPLPIFAKRPGSDKSNSSHSPVASKPTSLKEHGSHIPTRINNISTGSSSSTSSEDLTHPPNRVMPSKLPSSVFSQPMKSEKAFGSQFPKMLHRPSVTPMPEFEAKTLRDVESQPWFKDMDREEAQREIERMSEAPNGTFIVRPRPDSNAKPYAMTLWANGKFYNFVIRKRDDDEYALGSKKNGERTFINVVKLIEYHQKHDIVLADGGGVKLATSP